MVMDLFFSCLRIGLAVYAGLCLLLFLRQSSYVYYPGKGGAMTPADVGLDFESLRLKTSDGESLACWFVPSEDGTGRSAVLFCHGNAGTMEDRLGALRLFHDMGHSVLIFDYRGYGHSSGQPSEKGTYLDAMAGWVHLTGKRGFPETCITIYGRSLGGAVAAWLASRTMPGALVIESSFTSAPDMAASMFPYLPSRLLCRFRYDTDKRLREVRCPVLIAHSEDDEMIPFEHARSLYSAASEPKVLIPVQGGHNTGGLEASASYQEKLGEFVRRHVCTSNVSDSP